MKRLTCHHQKVMAYGSKDPDVANSLPFVISSLVESCLHSFLSGENSVSPTGGFHHAGFKSGSGFCTFNGLVVAAQMIRELGAKSVGILDLEPYPRTAFHGFRIRAVFRILLTVFGIPYWKLDGVVKTSQLVEIIGAIFQITTKCYKLQRVNSVRFVGMNQC